MKYCMMNCGRPIFREDVSCDICDEAMRSARESSEYREFIANQRCIVCTRDGINHNTYSDPCHVRTKRNHGDVENIVPMCRMHHIEQHTIGILSFQVKHRINLRWFGRKYWALYRAQKQEYAF